MRFILFISDCMIPLVFLYIIGYALLMKINVYDEFIKGAKDGFRVVLDIIPTIIGLMVAVGILRASGTLELLTKAIQPLAVRLGFPSQLVPIAFMRMISSSASTGLVLDLFKNYGPDSIIGRMTSIMMGCTETVFYTMSVYFMTINIKKTRYTLSGALLVTFAGIIASIFITHFIFG